MNIAVLIGVSEYSNGIQNLPGSLNDVIQFERLIRATDKYEEILTISEKSSSITIKDKLARFINSKKDEAIEEVFFYFTGHGDFSNDEFYYILPDFSFDKKTQTSLQNSELDSLIKSLTPKLVTKVVDACHSGVNYIKDVKAIDTYIKSTTNQFSNCYFLYSSLNSQSSYQNKDFSFFTLSFFNALKKHIDKNVRYKDVIDYISDEFSSFPEQTPFFVTQADFTEVFCMKGQKIRDFLVDIPSTFPDTSKQEEEEKKEFSTLEDMVKADAKNHLTFEEVCDILEDIKQCVNDFKLSPEIENLFEFKVTYPKYIPTHVNYHQIGLFVAKNKDRYFATANYRTETYEEIEKPSNIERMIGRQTEPYTVTKKRQVIDGYSLTVNYPYSQILIDVNSKLPNIDSYNCTIAFVTSDRKIKVYYFITNYTKVNWNSREMNKRFEWNANELLLKDAEQINQYIKDVILHLNKRVVGDLKLKFDIKEDE